MNKAFLKFTLIEWAVAALILLVLARFYWAEEAARFEDRIFESVGAWWRRKVFDYGASGGLGPVSVVQARAS